MPHLTSHYLSKLICAAGFWSALLITLRLPVFSEPFPERPIKIIVPTNAGGEVDTMARIFQRSVQENQLLPVKLVVLNLPGAGGTLGTRRLKESPPDGYTIALWTPGIVTSKAMGIVDYDHTDFEIIGRTGYSGLGLGVKSDSQFETIQSLIEQSKKDPRSVRVATNIGLPVHFIPLMFADSIGIEFNFIQIGGGAKRLSSLLGSHTDLSLFSMLEFIQHQGSGIRPIVLLSEERSPFFPNTPTANEIGVDLVMSDMRIWLAPKGTPPERLETLRGALRATLKLPKVLGEFKALGIEPSFGDAAELQPYLDHMLERVTPLVSKARGL